MPPRFKCRSIENFIEFFSHFKLYDAEVGNDIYFKKAIEGKDNQ